jgi:cell division protein ZapA
MATVDLEIAGRSYPVACRDGEEAHLQSLAALVDRKARDAAGAVGSMGETRQFLFAALLLADELKDVSSGTPPAHQPDPEPAPQPEPQQQPDPAIGDALERLAFRMEMLAERLESRSETS